jgi:hypothetical protein
VIWIFIRYWLWIFLPWSIVEAWQDAREAQERETQ